MCTNESAVIAHGAIAAALEQELKRNGCHICSDARARPARDRRCFPEGKFDVALIGKPAEIIAGKAGLRVPHAHARAGGAARRASATTIRFRREKLCPVLGFYVAATREAAMIACRAMTRRMGGGHSAAIHASDPDIILRFGAEMNVLRISVNVGNSLGASGFETHLAPTMTIGTGYFGRSSVARECRAAASGAMGEAGLEQATTRIQMPSFDAAERLREAAHRHAAQGRDRL